MTVSSTDNKVIYSGADTTGPFSFSFKVDVDADLTVVKTDSSGVETTLTITTDYTVSRNSDQDASPGGSVTTVANVATGETLTILRELTLTQETDFSPFSSLPAETLEDVADRLTMMAQQINERIGRGLTLPVSESSIGDLPTSAARAGKLLSFDSNGDPIATTTVTGVSVSTFMEGVLDDTTATEARTTLGAEAADADILKADKADTLNVGFDWDTYQITYAGAITIDPQNGPTQYVTLTGDPTITLPVANDYSIFLEIIQDATGSRAVTWSGADDVNGSISTAADSRTEVHIKNTNGWVTINARDVTP